MKKILFHKLYFLIIVCFVIIGNTYSTNATNNIQQNDEMLFLNALKEKIFLAKTPIQYDYRTAFEDIDTVTLGRYPQSDRTGTIIEPIEWIVVKKENGKALLLSKYILHYMMCVPTIDTNVWEKFELRQWLQNTFL